jgi:hypothetical protein
MTKLQRLIEKIVEGAIFCGVKKPPGAFVKMLSEDDRKLLRTAKAKDFYYRWK